MFSPASGRFFHYSPCMSAGSFTATRGFFAGSVGVFCSWRYGTWASAIWLGGGGGGLPSHLALWGGGGVV